MNNYKNKMIAYIATILLVLGLTSCGSAEGALDSSATNDRLSVVTTIFPEYDWVREIIGQSEDSVDKSASDKWDVSILLDNGVDLHSFQPTASDIASISTCDIFIYVGGESDAWVEDALKETEGKDIIIIDLLDVLGEQVKEEETVQGMESEEADNHDGDADSEEDEVEYDEHVWLSLRNAELFCEVTADALSQKDPASKDVYTANLEAYVERLDALDKEYAAAVDNGKVDTLLFADRFPFRYMVDDYGLSYYAAFSGCSAETEASFETVVFLAGKVDELGLPAICTIEGGDQRIAETVRDNTESKGQEIVTMNSLQSTTSNDVESGATYYGIMKDNLEILKKALGE